MSAFGTPIFGLIPMFQTVSEGSFSELRFDGVLRSSVGPGPTTHESIGLTWLPWKCFPDLLRVLLKRHLQDAHGLVIVSRQGVLPAALGRPSPLLELCGVGIVGEVQPVEYPPQVRVIQSHALKGGVQFVVALGLGEPPQGLFLGRVLTFAHVFLPSFALPSPSYDTEC
jgi:hypothetical protein